MKAHDCVLEGKTSVADAGVEMTGGGSIYSLFHTQICACWQGLVTWPCRHTNSPAAILSEGLWTNIIILILSRRLSAALIARFRRPIIPIGINAAVNPTQQFKPKIVSLFMIFSRGRQRAEPRPALCYSLWTTFRGKCGAGSVLRWTAFWVNSLTHRLCGREGGRWVMPCRSQNMFEALDTLMSHECVEFCCGSEATVVLEEGCGI